MKESGFIRRAACVVFLVSLVLTSCKSTESGDPEVNPEEALVGVWTGTGDGGNTKLSIELRQSGYYTYTLLVENDESDEPNEIILTNTWKYDAAGHTVRFNVADEGTEAVEETAVYDPSAKVLRMGDTTLRRSNTQQEGNS